MKKYRILHYAELAQEMQKPPATVYRWLNGLRGISPSVAVELERITGVKAEAWVFPCRWRNPYWPEKYNKAA